MADKLIIGYGNPTRSDDGIGWHAVDALQLRLNDKADFITDHQLLPEMALDLEGYQRVVFIDAAVGEQPGEICFMPLKIDQPTSKTFTHHVHPQDLLALANLHFNSHPEACLITVTGEYFQFSEELSKVVREAIPEVVELTMEFFGGVRNSWKATRRE